MTWVRRGGAFGEGYSLRACGPGGVPMLLTLPDVRQRDTFDCGEAVARSILRFFRVSGWNRLPPFATVEHGAHPAQVQQTLILAGLRTHAGAFRVSHLRAACNDGCPVLCVVKADDGQGHWVGVRGVSRGWVHYHDPAAGPSKRREADWSARWHDVGMYGDRFEDFGIVVWKRA